MRTLKGLLFASVVALSALAGRARAQRADGATVESAILDILLARGIITAEEYEELASLARAQVDASRGEIELVEARLARLRAPDIQAKGGGPTQLKFESPDGTWSLGFSGRLQARAELFDSEDETKDDVNFSVPRARLTMGGNMGSPKAIWQIDIDAGTGKTLVDPASQPDTSLRNAFADFSQWRWAALRLGQFKFPFGREIQISSNTLAFQERAVANDAFVPNFEPGAMLYGHLDDHLVEWWAAVSNGDGRGKNNTPGDEKNGLRTGARVVVNPLGPMPLDSTPFKTLETGETLLGFGGSWMSNEDSTSISTVTPDADTVATGLEFQLFSGPFSLLSEVFRRKTRDDTADDFDDEAAVVQAGWLFNEHWEVVARWAEVDFGAKDDLGEKALGVNWYLSHHDSKWQFDLAQLDNDGTTPDAKRLRVQYHMRF